MTANRHHARAPHLVIGLSVVAAIALAACSSAGSSASPTPSSPAAVATATAAAGSQGTASQSDTDWGRIWDSLPSGFPTIAGSTPSEEAATGPASATFTVNGNAAKTIATTLQTQLMAAGYTTVALGGPLEDGTYTLDMSGQPAGCILQVKAAPLGSVTTVTILYGATCPHG
ncbi:MAG TPA: hypothetical protein VIM25_04870 [Candidatus Limnocylindrales bacterium]